VRGEGVMWCDGGGRHWWVLTTWVVVVICGHIISVCGQSFSYVGGGCVVVVVAVCHGWS